MTTPKTRTLYLSDAQVSELTTIIDEFLNDKSTGRGTAVRLHDLYIQLTGDSHPVWLEGGEDTYGRKEAP